MLFYPKGSKFKKHQKGCLKNNKNPLLKFKEKTSTSIKIMSQEHGNLSTRQLIAMRFLMRKILKKRGVSLFKAFPQIMVTKKPAGIRMGKGKGSLNCWVAKIKPGLVLCEIFSKDRLLKRIRAALRKVQIRLPIKTKVL